jgi:hypothetical protein
VTIGGECCGGRFADAAITARDNDSHPPIIWGLSARLSFALRRLA